MAFKGAFSASILAFETFMGPKCSSRGRSGLAEVVASFRRGQARAEGLTKLLQQRGEGRNWIELVRRRGKGRKQRKGLNIVARFRPKLTF